MYVLHLFVFIVVMDLAADVDNSYCLGIENRRLLCRTCRLVTLLYLAHEVWVIVLNY